jgi:hypothetical protein
VGGAPAGAFRPTVDAQYGESQTCRFGPVAIGWTMVKAEENEAPGSPGKDHDHDRSGRMPSISYKEWRLSRAKALDAIASGHSAVSGSGRGQRFNTQQFNQAYAVLLAAQFQGFCRDLHGECAGHILATIAPPPALQELVRDEMTRGRLLDRGNAQPSSIGADFGRFDIAFWDEVKIHDSRNATRMKVLEELNHWRNAIVHQDLDAVKLGGTTILRLQKVRRWRGACNRLARAFDEVMGRHLQNLTGSSPW